VGTRSTLAGRGRRRRRGPWRRRRRELDHLRITRRHLGGDFVDRDLIAAGLLRRLLAARAHRHGDLIASATGVSGATEHLPGDHRKQLIVRQVPAGVAGDLRLGLAHQRQRLAADLESEHMAPRLLARPIGGTVAELPSRHHRLDLAHRAPPRRVDPLDLGLGDGNSRELAHR
jgi:hypothetical protein